MQLRASEKGLPWGSHTDCFCDTRYKESERVNGSDP